MKAFFHWAVFTIILGAALWAATSAAQTISTVNTVSALNSGTFTNATLYLRGYTTTGDGGEGMLELSSSSCTPNNGTTFNDNVGHCYIRDTSSYQAGHINVLWFGADPTDTTNSSSNFQAALNALTNLGSSNAQGVLDIPAGHYLLNSGITHDPTSTLNCESAILDFKNLSSGTAITEQPYSNGALTDQPGTPITGSCIINGPGAGTSTIGLTWNGYMGASSSHLAYRDLYIENFGVGAQQANNTYALQFFSCKLYNNGVDWYSPSGTTNSSEIIEFHGCLLGAASTSSVKNYGPDMDLEFFGGSVDYDSGVSVDGAGDLITAFHGTHFEGSAGRIFAQNTTSSGSPYFFCYLCTFTGDGSASYPMLDGTQMHIVVEGGWIRIGSGTQATFLKSEGIYNAVIRDLEGINTPTTMIDTAGTSAPNTKLIAYAGAFQGSSFGTLAPVSITNGGGAVAFGNITSPSLVSVTCQNGSNGFQEVVNFVEYTTATKLPSPVTFGTYPTTRTYDGTGPSLTLQLNGGASGSYACYATALGNP